MRIPFLAIGVIAAVAVVTPAVAQLDPMNPVPGGATGKSAQCIQIGDLNSGAFLGTYWVTETGAWKEKLNAEEKSNDFEEIVRTEEFLEIYDTARSISLQFGFARKKVRNSKESPGKDWQDLYVMLNATDKDGSGDCIALATRAAQHADQLAAQKVPGAPPAAPGASTAAPGAPPVLPVVASRGQGGTTVQFVTVRPNISIRVPAGQQLTATSGPPCPGQAGFFLCPNQFTCAPIGGVCCPGAGSCAPGTYCDRFIPNGCIGPGSPAFCAGTGDPVTGTALHCAPGSTCLPGNFCVP